MPTANERAEYKRAARETAESHRHAYIRLTPDQRVNVCIDLEAMSLEWRREAMASRNEIGRLRQLVRDLNKIVGASDEPGSSPGHTD